jgi:hypothetical protein
LFTPTKWFPFWKQIYSYMYKWTVICNICIVDLICVQNVQKHNSLNNPYLYSNLCNKSLYLAIIRSHTFHLQRQIILTLKIIRLSKCLWSQPKMFRIFLKMFKILDPRILHLEALFIVNTWLHCIYKKGVYILR